MLANMVLVRKSMNKCCMCVSLTDLNICYPKDMYPLSDIDPLIDRSLGYQTLSLMDAYSRYN